MTSKWRNRPRTIVNGYAVAAENTAARTAAETCYRTRFAPRTDDVAADGDITATSGREAACLCRSGVEEQDKGDEQLPDVAVAEKRLTAYNRHNPTPPPTIRSVVATVTAAALHSGELPDDTHCSALLYPR